MLRKKGLLLFLGLMALIFSTEAQVYMPVTWSYSTTKSGDCEYELLFKATIDKGFHLYSQIPVDNGPLPTEFHFEKSDAYELVGKTREPKPIEHVEPVFDNAKLRFFEKEAVFKQKIKIRKAGKVVVNGTIDGMACDDSKCINFFPLPKFEFTIPDASPCTASVEAPAPGVSPNEKKCVCDTHAIYQYVLGKTKPGIKDSIPKQKETGVNSSASTPGTSNPETVKASGDCNPLESFLYGCGGGFLALITPCVYSMIPLTVSFFTKRSKTKAEGRKNAILYGLFIIFIYVVSVMSLVIIFGPTVLEKMSSNVWVNLFFFAVFLLFAFSFLGAFEITLPSSWINKTDSASDRGGIGGIFFMALTLVLVSFSCTGPFLGNLIPLISKGSFLCPLFGMIGFGLMLALPFALFAFFPAMLNSLPKSGGWLNTVKVTLGIVEIALALKFFSQADTVAHWHILSREKFIALWIALSGILSLYLFGKLKFSHDSDMPHLGVPRFMVAFLCLSLTIYLIPGLWGAPLNFIAGFPPPQTPEWSENIDAFSSGSSNTGKASPVITDLKVPVPETNCPKGISNCFHNYYEGLAYARAVKKPMLVDFTGWTCLNCRKTEQGVWPKPEVLSQINNDYVLVSLYVDETNELPKDSQYVSPYSKDKIKRIGEKWHEMEIYRFKQNALPYYVLLDNDGKELNTPIPYTDDPAKYATFLREGRAEFEKRMKK